MTTAFPSVQADEHTIKLCLFLQDSNEIMDSGKVNKPAIWNSRIRQKNMTISLWEGLFEEINQNEMNRLSWSGCKRQATFKSYYESEIEDDKSDMREKVKEKDISSKGESVSQEWVQYNDITYKKTDSKVTVYYGLYDEADRGCINDLI